MGGATDALIRAARRAHKFERQAGTDVVLMRDDKAMEIEPDPERYGEVGSKKF